MADISRFRLPGSDVIYNLKDQGARDLISALPKAMVFKGTISNDPKHEVVGTISELPTAAASIVGHTYKVIYTNVYPTGTSTSVYAKVGDLFTCADIDNNTYMWVHIPSGDEPSGTVTNISAGTGIITKEGQTAGPITSSGSVAVDTDVVVTTSDTWVFDCGTSTTNV